MERFCSGCGILSGRLDEKYNCPSCQDRLKAIDILALKKKPRKEEKKNDPKLLPLQR